MHNSNCMYTELFLCCFNSGFFSYQVTNVLTEVVPSCKSGHIYYMAILLIDYSYEALHKQSQKYTDNAQCFHTSRTVLETVPLSMSSCSLL